MWNVVKCKRDDESKLKLSSARAGNRNSTYLNLNSLRCSALALSSPLLAHSLRALPSVKSRKKQHNRAQTHSYLTLLWFLFHSISQHLRRTLAIFTADCFSALCLSDRNSNRTDMRKVPNEIAWERRNSVKASLLTTFLLNFSHDLLFSFCFVWLFCDFFVLSSLLLPFRS
jgi:hypothetical protein